MKYKNYAELSAAFKSGELDEHYYLMLDKGGTQNYLSYYNGNLTDEENENKQDECSSWFNGDDCEIETIFQLAGIRCEWC